MDSGEERAINAEIDHKQYEAPDFLFSVIDFFSVTVRRPEFERAFPSRQQKIYLHGRPRLRVCWSVSPAARSLPSNRCANISGYVLVYTCNLRTFLDRYPEENLQHLTRSLLPPLPQSLSSSPSLCHSRFALNEHEICSP